MPIPPVLPADVWALLTCFAPLFSARAWRHVPPLVVGAILASGDRMVTTALRVVGLGQLATFQTYHRVVNRAAWSSRHASQILFGLLVTTFAPQGPVVVGIDETIERRQGKKIGSAGIYRDPVRSSRSRFVKVRGPCRPSPSWPPPSARPRTARRYKLLTTLARQKVWQLHRWALNRPLVVVGNRSYAALELLDAVRLVATVVARLRLDVRLFAPPPPRPSHRKRRPRLVGERLPNLSCHRDDPSVAWVCAQHPAVVLRARSPGRGPVPDGHLVLDRLPAGAHPLGADPRPARRVRDASPALHRPGRRPAADRPMVHLALAARGHLPRGARPPRRRDGSTSGPSAPSRAPRRRCSASSPS